jgi:hypothetical protein
MSRRGAVTLLAIGAVPFLFLIVLELIAFVSLLGVFSEPGECLSEAPAATLATIWLAFGPLSAGIAAAIAGLQRGGPANGAPRAGVLGLMVLGSGVVICLLGSGERACAAAEWPGDGGGGSVPISGWGTASVLILAVTFGAICLTALLDDGSSDDKPGRECG